MTITDKIKAVTAYFPDSVMEGMDYEFEGDQLIITTQDRSPKFEYAIKKLKDAGLAGTWRVKNRA